MKMSLKTSTNGTQEVSGSKAPPKINLLSNLVILFDPQMTLPLIDEKCYGSRKCLLKILTFVS